MSKRHTKMHEKRDRIARQRLRSANHVARVKDERRRVCPLCARLGVIACDLALARIRETSGSPPFKMVMPRLCDPRRAVGHPM